MLDTLRRDGKHALRRLARDWQFSAGAILILALGIGANSAFFSVVSNVLFQPLPFADLHQLVNIYQNEAKNGEPEGVSYPAFRDLQNESTVFDGVAAMMMIEGRYQTVDPQGNPGSVRAALFEYASANHLEVLGMKPSLGRWFTEEEEHTGQPVAVLGWATWIRDFASDPAVIGRVVRVSGHALQVIGVGPAGFNNSQSNSLIVSLWMPVKRLEQQSSAVAQGMLEKRDNLLLQVFARLRAGVTVRQAQAAMDVTARRFAADHADGDPSRGMTVLATKDVRVHPRAEKLLKPVAAIVLAVVGLVLAIACSNLATLLLVRSSARSTEISVRLALGATRWQLVRHLLMESIVLSFAGAGVGVALAAWGLKYLSTVELPVVVVMQLDYRALGFAILVATLCGVGFGLSPALQVTRKDLATALREQRGSAGGALSLSRGWFTLKNALIVGQVAASFLLLMGAVLMTGILVATQMRAVGYRTAGIAMIEMDARYAGYDLARARSVFEELRRSIAELPGVESAYVSAGFPAGGQFDRKLAPEGSSAGEAREIEGRWADPGYFQTLEIPVLFGRVFDERDGPQTPEIVVVCEAFARRQFGASNAVGKRIRFGDIDAKPVEIVGVVGNTRSIDMVLDRPKQFFYRSATQAAQMPSVIVARTSANDMLLLAEMQQLVRKLQPGLPVIGADTMREMLAKELGIFRVSIWSLGGLASVGLALAGVGLYAVVAFAVAQRSSEIGIRVALGARAGSLTWLVVRDVTALVMIGIVIGALFSWAGLILFKSSVGPVMGANPAIVAFVAALIALFGAVAAYVPARRAARIDPLVAIRHE